jgi:hypothetical protein
MIRIKVILALIAVMVMVMAAAAPAALAADGGNNNGGIDQETDETGDIAIDASIVNTGNNSNQCAAPLQFGNTGNLQNAQFFNQFDSDADDVEFDGGTFEFNPEQAVECNQQVQQSAAASSR